MLPLYSGARPSFTAQTAPEASREGLRGPDRALPVADTLRAPQVPLEHCGNCNKAGVATIPGHRQRSAAGIQLGFMLVMIQAPPKAISPAQTICGIMPISAVPNPITAPTTDCTALSRSFEILWKR